MNIIFIIKYMVVPLWLVITELRHIIGHSRSMCTSRIGSENEYPTMHYFGIPRHTQSMISYKILTEYFWKFH